MVSGVCIAQKCQEHPILDFADRGGGICCTTFAFHNQQLTEHDKPESLKEAKGYVVTSLGQYLNRDWRPLPPVL